MQLIRVFRCKNCDDGADYGDFIFSLLQFNNGTFDDHGQLGGF